MARIETLTALLDEFKSEKDCILHLYALRTKDGWTCSKCGSSSPSLLLGRRKIQCTRCSHQQAITSGTPMERSHIALRKWFLAMYLVASDKRGISALALAHELRIKRDSASYLLKRIRGSMAERGAFNALDGEVEIDDAYLGSPGEGLAGRGTDRAPFIVAVNRGKGGCSMRAVSDCKSGSYLEFGSWHLARSSHVRADGWAGCRRGLAGWPGLDQKAFSADEKDASLPVVHHLISNFKALAVGTYHGIARDRLQGYLDEFSWRYCHRADPCKFASLLTDVISSAKRTSSQLDKLLFVQLPQPDAPDWKKRQRVQAAVMR